MKVTAPGGSGSSEPETTIAWVTLQPSPGRDPGTSTKRLRATSTTVCATAPEAWLTMPSQPCTVPGGGGGVPLVRVWKSSTRRRRPSTITLPGTTAQASTNTCLRTASRASAGAGSVTAVQSSAWAQPEPITAGTSIDGCATRSPPPVPHHCYAPGSPSAESPERDAPGARGREAPGTGWTGA